MPCPICQQKITLHIGRQNIKSPTLTDIQNAQCIRSAYVFCENGHQTFLKNDTGHPTQRFLDIYLLALSPDILHKSDGAGAGAGDISEVSGVIAGPGTFAGTEVAANSAGIVVKSSGVAAPFMHPLSSQFSFPHQEIISEKIINDFESLPENDVNGFLRLLNLSVYSYDILDACEVLGNSLPPQRPDLLRKFSRLVSAATTEKIMRLKTLSNNDFSDDKLNIFLELLGVIGVTKRFIGVTKHPTVDNDYINARFVFQNLLAKLDPTLLQQFTIFEIYAKKRFFELLIETNDIQGFLKLLNLRRYGYNLGLALTKFRDFLSRFELIQLHGHLHAGFNVFVHAILNPPSNRKRSAKLIKFKKLTLELTPLQKLPKDLTESNKRCFMRLLDIEAHKFDAQKACENFANLIIREAPDLLPKFSIFFAWFENPINGFNSPCR